MKLSERRKELMKPLENRAQESFESRNDSGRVKGVFKSGITVPEWICKEGEHAMDIIPYVVGEGNPNERLKPGDLAYVLLFWVHDNVGVNSDRYICLSRNYKKPCPLCEERKRLEDTDADEEVVKKLKPKRRALYNIWVLDDPKEEEKGVQIWEVAHWFMESHISELAKKRGGGYIPFSHPDKGIGKTVVFRREGKGAGNVNYIGHRFEDRDYDIPDDILDQSYCLEDLIHIPSYEEVYTSFWGEPPAHESVHGIRRKPTSVPATETTSPKETVSCPYGGVFAVDTDQIEPCGQCEIHVTCLTEFDKKNPPKATSVRGKSFSKQPTTEQSSEPQPEHSEPPITSEKDQSFRRGFRRVQQ